MITITWTDTREEGSRYYLVGQWFVDGTLQGSIESPTTSEYELITQESTLISMLEDRVTMEQYL